VPKAGISRVNHGLWRGRNRRRSRSLKLPSRPVDPSAPSTIYCSCRDVAQFDGMRLYSGDRAHIRHSPGQLPGLSMI
jgi:hypothetical protein